jgi:hypothetical protein
MYPTTQHFDNFPTNPKQGDVFVSARGDKFEYYLHWKYIAKLSEQTLINCTQLHKVLDYDNLKDIDLNTNPVGTIVTINNQLYILTGIWDLIYLAPSKTVS